MQRQALADEAAEKRTAAVRTRWGGGTNWLDVCAQGDWGTDLSFERERHGEAPTTIALTYGALVCESVRTPCLALQRRDCRCKILRPHFVRRLFGCWRCCGRARHRACQRVRCCCLWVAFVERCVCGWVRADRWEDFRFLAFRLDFNGFYKAA